MPKNSFNADDARKSVDKFKHQQKSAEQKREEKRQTNIQSDLKTLPETLERDWLPAIRKAAREGRKKTSVMVFSREAGLAGCKLLKKRGFEAECDVHTYHGSDDDPGTEWDIIVIKW